MSFKTKVKSGEGDFELPPGGTYPAMFIGLIDLGTHPREYGGKKWDEHKIYFLWELTSEQNAEGENFVVARDYTFSLHEKAHLRKMIEGFTGKAMTDDQELDVLLFVGKQCIVNISEGESAKKKKFIEVTSVGRPMKGQTIPPASRKPYIFDFEFHSDFKEDPPVPDWVPMLYGRSIIEEIKKSPEWQAGAALGIPASTNGNGNGHKNGSGAKPMTQKEADMAMAAANDDEAPY